MKTNHASLYNNIGAGSPYAANAAAYQNSNAANTSAYQNGYAANTSAYQNGYAAMSQAYNQYLDGNIFAAEFAAENDIFAFDRNRYASDLEMFNSDIDPVRRHFPATNALSSDANHTASGCNTPDTPNSAIPYQEDENACHTPDTPNSAIPYQEDENACHISDTPNCAIPYQGDENACHTPDTPNSVKGDEGDAVGANANEEVHNLRSESSHMSSDKDTAPKPQVWGVGALDIRPVTDWMMEAQATPDPVMLWKEFFLEGEVCCLFADSNVGKSILAVQIANDIALAGKKVLYVDFELSCKQFQRRYSQEETDYQFPDNLLRAEISMDPEADYDQMEVIVPNIQAAIIKNQIDVVIIDNITWLTSGTAEKAEVAAPLIKNIINIKRDYEVSMLILAHTPKRDSTMPLTQNDLAGSKMIMNFVDSAFAIGKSQIDENLRYLKQIKSRSTEMTYGADNVITCNLIREDAFLKFNILSYDHEAKHLHSMTEKNILNLEKQVVSMRHQGKKMREIAERFQITISKVQRILQRQSKS